MQPQTAVDPRRIQTLLQLGHFNWQERNPHQSFRDWILGELVHLQAPIPLLILFLSQPVDREALKSLIQKEIQSAKTDETKKRWIALSCLLTTIPNWDSRLAEVSAQPLGESSEGEDGRLKRSYHQVILATLESTLKHIQEKLGVSDLDDENSVELFYAHKGQIAALKLFLSKFRTIKKGLATRNGFSDLKLAAQKISTHLMILHGIQLQYEKVVEKEELLSKQRLESKHARIRKQCEKAFKNGQQKILEACPHALHGRLSDEVTAAKEFFFTHKFYMRLATPLEYINGFVFNFQKTAVYYPHLKPHDIWIEHLNSLPILGPHMLQTINKKSNNCLCCNMGLSEHKYKLNQAARQTLIQHLFSSHQLMDLLHHEVKSKIAQVSGSAIPVSSPAHDLEELEELEDPSEATESSSVHSSNPTSESSEATLFEEPPAAAPSVLSTFLESIHDPSCDKREALPMLLRFTTQTFHPGSRLETTYQESLSHIHLAHHGLEVFTEALVHQDYCTIAAILPNLIMDWYVQAEQLANFKIRQQGKEEVASHSLMHLFQVSKDWDTLSPMLQKYLRELDCALFWYRYPYSYQSRFNRSAEVPSALKVILQAADALQATKVDGAKLKEWILFVRQSQECALLLFKHCSPLKYREEEFAQLYPCYASGSWLDQFWKEIPLLPPSKGIAYAQANDCLAQIDHLLTLTHPERKIDTKIKNALRDARFQIQRLGISLQSSSVNSNLFAWHTRNYIQIQWAFEQIYMCRLHLVDPNAKFEHDFHILQLRLGDTFKQPEQALTKIKAFNWETGIHHPWQKRTQNPFFESFVAAVQEDNAAFGLEFPAEKADSPSRKLFVETQKKMKEGITLLLFVLNQLTEELEAQGLKAHQLKIAP